MVGAYGANNINFDGIVGDGSGQTIAIADWYDDPGMVDSSSSSFATSDLALFDAEYGLPNPPSFIKYGVTITGNSTAVVSTTVPGTDPSGPYQTTGTFGTELEESLDVEWAHAFAPKANIVLIEADDGQDAYYAVAAADALGGVNVVSMSFGGDESQLGSKSEETYYNTNIFGTAGITYVASAGDSGIYGTGNQDTIVEPEFPATSTSVLAVGGTTLSVSGTTWSGETVWGNGTSSGSEGGGGGGTSLYESRPTYQNGFTTSSKRAYPDISLEANNSPGVPVLDSFDDGSSTPWCPVPVGGTSLAAPSVAGLVAIADQGRALDGLSTLNSNSVGTGVDIHTLTYSLASSTTTYAADFHDITSGTNGISATTGYDEASGLGSPKANNLVFDWSGISSTAAVNQPAITNLYIKDYSSTQLEIWVNSSTPGSGTPTYKFYLADASAIQYNGGTGNDVLTLDYSAGNFASGLTSITYDGSSGGSNTINFVGTTSSDSLSLTSTTITPSGGFGTTPITLSNVQNVSFPGGSGGSDTVSVLSSPAGGYNLNADTPLPGTPNVSVSVGGSADVVNFTASQHLAGLTISSTDVVNLTLSAASAGKVLVLASLTDAGALDLYNNVAIIHNGAFATITSLVGTGYASGTWTGNGIRSTTAHGTTNTALGTILNNDGSGKAIYSTFDGQPVTNTDVLIKYTYFGDTNLDGIVNASDYTKTDTGYNSQYSGWANGDFNYDGTVNGSDYTLIDSAFNTQSGTL